MANFVKIRIGTRRLAIMACLTVGLLSFAGLIFAVTVSTRAKELKMVHIIMRHGIRTPADTYPNDPHINDTLYPIGWGQITNEGKEQLYEIGRYYRRRYDDFLGTHYYPDEYYTQTTDVDRTKTSMQIVNAGLWPPKADQQWGPLDWQPIPTHSEPLSLDSLLLVRRPCPVYHQERDKVIRTPEIQQKFDEYRPLFEDLTNYTGKVVGDFDDVQDIFSTLQAEESFNLTLPDWTEEYYPKKMFEPTIFSYILNAYNDKMNRLKGGVLLKRILQHWEAKAAGNEKLKAVLYGGHDSTIVNLMRTLKVWDPQFPNYSITILLELSVDETGTYHVEVFLRNSTVAEPYKLTVPGCDVSCPLTELKKLTEAVVPENWDEECKGDDENYTVPPPGGP
ncbi:testicular acid phosphatase homolog isoform X2 [Cylas formicarius]|uniref:testicular acid phosphatase homolog isoform X2 n=1 Tax=Cylas formicarius TaxID=197179 RepID=UPI002958CFEF|nr:testicular acid phosphatase homolog isoform X2 [Cylas formicarius]